MDDLLHRILQAAATYPNRPALSGHRRRTLRYRDLVVAVVATAKGLRHKGFQTGDRMLVSVRPDPAGMVLALGTVAAGGVVVFVDADSEPDLFSWIITVSEPRWAAGESVSLAAGVPTALRAITRRGRPRLPDYAALGIRTLRAGPWLPGVPGGTLSMRTLAHGRGIVDDEPLPGLREDPTADALVVVTTTPQGGPNAVVHTRGSLAARLSVLAGVYDISHRSRMHTDQLMLGLPTLAAGAHWRMPRPGLSPKVDPARFTKGIGRSTHLFVTPADLAPVLTAISEGLAPRPSALQHILVGGGPVLPPLVNRTRAVLPDVRLLAIYGRTEITPIAVASGTDKIGPDLDGIRVGELIPGVEATVADDGELIVTGPNLAARYLGRPPLTEYATGDLAILSGRTVVLSGRKDDAIIRGDKIIYPALYESAIEAMPAVGHAAVVGVPNEIGDERVVLALQPAGQRINDHPLAGEPKQSNSRDDDIPAAQQISVLLHHPLASLVAASLPNVVETEFLPDQIVVLSAIPMSRYGGRPDRMALRRLLAEVSQGEADQ